MVSEELLAILVCPETKQKVSPAPEDLVRKVNERIERGELKYRNGETITEPIDGGLLREDGAVLYAIRDDIPIMLIDEQIDVRGL